MSKCPFDDDWVPAQVKRPEIIDFRAIAYGPRGYKLKNKDKFAASQSLADSMEIDSTTPVRLGSTRPDRLGTGKVLQSLLECLDRLWL